MSTAGEKIFEKYFKIEIAEYEAVDERMVRARGSFTTGFGDLDAQLSKRNTQVWRTISQMVDLFNAGATFRLVHGLKAIQEIHEIIQEHMADVESYMSSISRSMRVEPPEVVKERLEDLRNLDELGRYIYNRIKTRKMPEVSLLFKGIDSFGAPLIPGNHGWDSLPGPGTKPADYVPVTERIDYSPLNRRQRYK